ncbi:MAG: hypothetical protein H8E37_10565 [Planctomycetes bacterium]|nr:hypothetical protein [Planctomycetota bacterium]
MRSLKKSGRQEGSRSGVHRNRPGISTIWVIVALPAVMTMFVMVVDIGHVWLARSELKNALDASALSTVKTWGEGGTTAQARLDGNDAMSTNTVLGAVVTLNTAEGGCTNGNVASTGEIVLGSITDSGGVITFDCSGSPSCISGTAELVIAVETDSSGDTFGDPTEPDGFARTSFRVERFEETTGVPVGLTLNSFTIDLTAMTTQPAGGGADSPDDGVFDLRVQGGAPGNSDVSEGIGTPPGPPPVAGLIGVNDQGVASSFAFSGGTPTEPRVLTVSFGGGGITSSAAAARFFVGVDADQVGGDIGGDIGGGGGAAAQDFGGEFGLDGGGGSGNDPFTSTGALISANISGQTVTGNLTRISDDRSEISFAVNIVAGGTAFGGRTRKTIQVRSICPSFLGLGLGPYNVTADSFARFTCTNGPPQLVRVSTVTCVCP